MEEVGLPPQFKERHRFAKRTELEQRIDALKVIYQGASNPERVRSLSGMNYHKTKAILVSFAKKGFVRLVRDKEGKTRHPRTLDQAENHRKFSHLSIEITEDGTRVLLAARTLKRQLLDEEIDWR